MMKVKYKECESANQVASFATQIGKKDLINIEYCCIGLSSWYMVWYWSN